MLKSLSLCLSLSATLFLAACGDSDDRPAECEEIVEACHDVDTGTGMVHECHESAESDWSREECMSMSSACLAACAAAGADGGTGDALR